MTRIVLHLTAVQQRATVRASLFSGRGSEPEFGAAKSRNAIAGGFFHGLVRPLWAAGRREPSGSPVLHRSLNLCSVALPFQSGAAVLNRNWSTTTMTTTDLVPVFTGTLAGQDTPLCNARDLHAFLQSEQEFANWIKFRIECGFTEGEDYLITLSNRSDGRAGRRRTDYHLTLEMAKHIALMERNEQGHQVRRYFIAMEKQARQQATPPALPAPETELDRQTRSRINRRAFELSHRAYETYCNQMMNCHLIMRGLVEIERWIPPQLSAELIDDAMSLAKITDTYGRLIRKQAAHLASMAGLEQPPGI